jgi:hypothetical protein
VVPAGIILFKALGTKLIELPLHTTVDIVPISAVGFTPTCKVNVAPTQEPKDDELTGTTI